MPQVKSVIAKRPCTLDCGHKIAPSDKFVIVTLYLCPEELTALMSYLSTLAGQRTPSLGKNMTTEEAWALLTRDLPAKR